MSNIGEDGKEAPTLGWGPVFNRTDLKKRFQRGSAGGRLSYFCWVLNIFQQVKSYDRIQKR